MSAGRTADKTKYINSQKGMYTMKDIENSLDNVNEYDALALCGGEVKVPIRSEYGERLKRWALRVG